MNIKDNEKNIQASGLRYIGDVWAEERKTPEGKILAREIARDMVLSQARKHCKENPFAVLYSHMGSLK